MSVPAIKELKHLFKTMHMVVGKDDVKLIVMIARRVLSLYRGHVEGKINLRNLEKEHPTYFDDEA